jgi:hypothetical protein
LATTLAFAVAYLVVGLFICLPAGLVANVDVLYCSLQLSTKLLDKGDLRDSLKLVYDFHNRFGE